VGLILVEPVYLFLIQLLFMLFKKFCLLPVLLISTIALQAQFKKGDNMVGASIGNVAINSGSSDVSFPQTQGYSSKSSGYSIRFEPTWGWFISDKTVVGVSLNVNPGKQKISYEDAGTTFQRDESSNFNIGVGAFLRNYFSTSKSFMPFGQFGFNAGINSSSIEGFRYYAGPYKISYDGKSSGGFFANSTLQLGLTKMMGENTGLDFYAGYNFSYSSNTFKTTTLRDDGVDGTIDTRSENEPTTKFTNHGFILGVGFQVFLRKK